MIANYYYCLLWMLVYSIIGWLFLVTIITWAFSTLRIGADWPQEVVAMGGGAGLALHTSKHHDVWSAF